MTRNDARIENTLNMIEKYKVDGVIEIILQACHTFNVESVSMRRTVEDAGIPYMKIETDYSLTDSGQLATRIEAFIRLKEQTIKKGGSAWRTKMQSQRRF